MEGGKIHASLLMLCPVGCKCDTYTETLYGIIGGNLSEERLSPVPPSKDFLSDFFSDRARPANICRAFLFWSRPIREKIKPKVLGKEFEEEPFFKRVFLNIPHKNFYISTVLKCADFLHICKV